MLGVNYWQGLERASAKYLPGDAYGSDEQDPSAAQAEKNKPRSAGQCFGSTAENRVRLGEAAVPAGGREYYRAYESIQLQLRRFI